MTTATEHPKAIAEALASPSRRSQPSTEAETDSPQNTPADEPAEPEKTPTIYSTLSELVRKEDLTMKGMRPYRVKKSITSEAVFVVSNSPGNAAQAVCVVTACKSKDILEATRTALKQAREETKV